MEISKLVRPNILKMSPYSSARSEFKGMAKVFLDANENPFPLGYNRYPDPLQKELKKLISAYRSVDSDCIMLGNGSDEIIDLLVRVFCIPGKDNIYTFKPGFGMYKVAASINDVGYTEYALDDNFHLHYKGFLSHMPNSCKMIFLCSPNNPTGNSIAIEDVVNILEKFDGIVVVDEAYIDFSNNASLLSQLTHHKNLVVLQTFSKALGSAGIRIGMAFADKEIIHYLNNVKMPYNISKINQEEGIKALQKLHIYKEQLKELLKEKQKVYTMLKNKTFIDKVYPSDANFYLVKCTNASALYQHLLFHGVVVRDRSNQFGCNNCVRISIGTSEENLLLDSALDSYAKI